LLRAAVLTRNRAEDSTGDPVPEPELATSGFRHRQRHGTNRTHSRDSNLSTLLADDEDDGSSTPDEVDSELRIFWPTILRS